MTRAGAPDHQTRRQPLSGLTAIDLSRMLPGAVLARQLIDLGARLIKVEDPATGDPFRHLPPLVDGIGAGFTAFLRGAESVTLDLSDPEQASAVRRLTRSSDIVIQSFRPGMMETWGLGRDRLRALNPGLISVSLPAYASSGKSAGRIGHDLNLVAESGLLAAMTSQGVPPVQIADITTGLLAATSIVAALLERARTGLGQDIEQPLISGTVPYLTWAWADLAAGGRDSLLSTVLGGQAPAYQRYRCECGRELAVAALEPKLWIELLEAVGLEQHAGSGLDPAEDGARASRDLASIFAGRPRDHWLELARHRGLAISAVNQPGDPHSSQALRDAGLLEPQADAEGAPTHPGRPGPFLVGLGVSPSHPAPALGEHTAAVLDEIGVDRSG